MTSPKSTPALLDAGRATETPLFAPAPVVIDHGAGMYLYDTEGREYLDFLGGIAVSTLGHAHPELVAAIADQASKVLHVSNGYFSEPQILLQQRLERLTFGDRPFLCNSGTEANEAAIKLARRYQRKLRGTRRFEILTFSRSFHGRSYGALSATAQPKYHDGFEPIVPGFVYAPWGDLDAVEGLIGAHTAAIMVEPVQGEGGVHVASGEFITGLRSICDREGILLIFDEIQSGIGRTGKWFAHQHFGIEPDIMTLAKGLGGGVPIGAVISRPSVTLGWQKGAHGTTFGGNPLATRAAFTVLDVVERDRLVERAAVTGEVFRAAARARLGGHGRVADVRGIGLINGIELRATTDETVSVIGAARTAGLLCNLAGSNVLRFVPPLIATAEDARLAVDRAAGAIESVLGSA